MLFDIPSRRFVGEGVLPFGDLYHAQFGPDDCLHCSTKDAIVRWNLDTGQIETLVDCPGRVPEDETRDIVFTGPREIIFAHGPRIEKVTW